MSWEITCINKDERLDPFQRITHVGGVKGESDQESWRLTLSEALEAIEKGTHSFHINKAGTKINVIISTSRRGDKYLKTEADDYKPNNLLSLPVCPHYE